MLNDVPVSSRLSTTPIAGDRNREHDDERVAQRLVLRRHHRVDEQDGEQQHQLQLLERLGLLLDLGAEADREVGRHANLAEARLHGRDGFAQRDLGLRVDAGDALHVLAVDLHRAGVARRDHDVLRRDHLAGGRAQEHVADVVDLLAIGLRAAARRSGIRCRARGTAPRWCRRRWSESSSRRPTPSARAWRPWADRRGPRFRGGLPRGRCARRRGPASTSMTCCASTATRRASSRSWPRISSARRASWLLPPPPEQALQLEVAAGRIGAHDDAGQAGELAAQVDARSLRWCASAGRAAPAGCGSGRGWSGRHRRHRRPGCCRRRRRW